MLWKNNIKGECLFILNRKIIYYTKELLRVVKIASIALIIIVAVIFIKYTPQYEVSVNGEKLGYIDSQNEIDRYINEKLEKEKSEGKNIAFVELKSTPTLKLELVDRNINNNEELIKTAIVNQVAIEYTNFAISIGGKNKTYVSSEEEAQKIIDELKKDYEEKYTKNIGIVQVYSDDYSEIEAESSKNAKKVISTELKSAKKADEIKIAKAKAAAKAAAKAQAAAANVTKSTNVNGIKFTVKPVSGTITSRFGYRVSPGGIGSTNHKGLDIAAGCGTPIYAAASGTVEFAGTNKSLGKYVIINHGSGVKTYYAHCNSLKVSAGQTVEAGTNIATVGKTGTATGYHLHFEVRVNGTSVNPQKYIY